MEKKKIIGLTLLFLCSNQFMIAQQTDTLTRELNEISIVGTRIEKNVLETGRSITVITQQDLSNSVYATLAEIIAAQEGIYMVGSGQTPGSNQSIFMRGANSNQTAIYVDGMRISDVSTVNNTADLSELPLNSIDRIEIIRGAHSTAYGSAAIGGVIQIFTKKNQENGLHADAQLASGTFGKNSMLVNPAIQTYFKMKNGFSVMADADVENVEGINSIVDTITDPLVYHSEDRDGWKKRILGGGVHYTGKTIEAGISFHDLYMKTDIDKGAFRDDDNYILKYKRQTFSGNLSCKINTKLSFDFTAGYSKNIRTSENDSSINSFDGTYDHNYSFDQYMGQTTHGELLFKYLGNHWKGIAGTSLGAEKMNSENDFFSSGPFASSSSANLDTVNPHTKSFGGIYLQADVDGDIISPALKCLHLLVGGRFMDQLIIYQETQLPSKKLQLNSFEINPSIQLIENTLLYFSFSTGYNAPSLYQLFAPTTNYISGLSTGNPNLKQESSTSFEFGLKQRIDRNGFIGISIFKSRTKDQIDYVYLWDKNIPIDSLGDNFLRDDYRGDRYLNIGTQTVYGIEVTFENQLTKQLKFHANVNLLNGYLDYEKTSVTDEQVSGNQVQLYNNGAFVNQSKRFQGLTRRPNSASVSLSYSFSAHVNCAINVSYTGTRNDLYYDTGIPPYGALAPVPVNDYVLAGLNGKYSLNEHYSIACRVENIFDKKYSEIRGFSTRGRGFYLKLMCTF